MTDIVNSLNGIPIRLPNERWQHIIQRHADIADQKDLILRAIAAPERLLAGNEGALMAVQSLELGKWLVSRKAQLFIKRRRLFTKRETLN
jgi:hypothetical protein